MRSILDSVRTRFVISKGGQLCIVCTICLITLATLMISESLAAPPHGRGGGSSSSFGFSVGGSSGSGIGIGFGNVPYHDNYGYGNRGYYDDYNRDIIMAGAIMEVGMADRVCISAVARTISAGE